MRQLRRDRDDDFAFRPDDENTAFIAGRNAVIEALKANTNADTLFIEKGQTGGSMSKIIALAKQAGCPIKEVTSQKLEGLAAGTVHQGVVLSVSAVEYAEVEDILAKAAEKGEKPFIIIADDIEDPHNLGAIIRTAETAGAHGVIIPKRRGVGLTSAVFKSSAGAAAHLPVARVANLASTVDELKEQGIWVYGCDMDGQNWCETDFSGGVALVIGSEGKGMSRLLKEKCDVMVSLPMRGQITSLNASVAGGIIMYEVTRQRLGISAHNSRKSES
ncbi:MAG: 23S rRNA (guanosine(2251)-2'-O)-methyltransferase RlmB [Candidatus Merdivicinus sp.]